MKKSLALAALALAAASLPSPAAAEGAKIGYIDVQQIAKRSRTIQDSVQSAETEIRKKQEAIELKIRDYGKSKEDLQARRSVLTPEELEKQQKKVDGLRDEIDVMRLEIDKHMRRTESDVMGPAVDRILEAARSVGKENGFDLILSSDIIVYAAEKSNLTPLVIEALDKGAPAAQPEEAKKEEPKPEAPKKDEPKKEAAKPAAKPAAKKK